MKSRIYFPTDEKTVRNKSTRVSNVEKIFNGESVPADIDELSVDTFQTDLNDFMRGSYDGNVLEQIIYLKNASIIMYSSSNKEVRINDFEKLKQYFRELYDYNH